MIANPKNLSEQLCNLSERLGIEMRALNRTKVSTVNGIVPDANGNVTIEAGGGSSEDCLKTSGGTFDGTAEIPHVMGDNLVTGTMFNTVDNASVISIVSADEMMDEIGMPKGSQLHLYGKELGSGMCLFSSSDAGVSAVMIDPNQGFTFITSGEGGFQQMSISPEGIGGILGNFVTSVNGKTADAYGNVTIEAGGYTLPKATSSTLGGVTIGSNISVSNGKISLTSSNVTNALGYTPVKSVNGKTGSAVTVDVGVTSINGQKGDVTIEVGGGGSGDAIPKTGNRGVLAGYETGSTIGGEYTLTKDSPDTIFCLGTTEKTAITVPDSDNTGISWTKLVVLCAVDEQAGGKGDVEFVLGSRWHWGVHSAPTLGTNGVMGHYYAVIFHWAGMDGFAVPVELYSA